ncbi:hypothetical protein MCNF_55120 [Mycolicibacterium confluentis]|uniref:Uncharacterized protein n=1 Tax=Mycolicibacterium confluentis TaxID=28047 RepID=A0A7I7Y5E7_9MYCO|nr:hypothetical protein MCNF_55120 [Mycolicibacterium confluentis]
MLLSRGGGRASFYPARGWSWNAGVPHVVPAERAEHAALAADRDGRNQVLYVVSTVMSGCLTLRVCGCERVSSTVCEHGSFNVCLPTRGRNIGLIGHFARPGRSGAGDGIEHDTFELRIRP